MGSPEQDQENLRQKKGLSHKRHVETVGRIGVFPPEPVAMSLPPLKEFLADKSWAGCAIAHRGAWHDTAENALRAVDHALAVGCQYVEIDVQETIDGVPFCLHDISLLRTTGRAMNAAAHHWSQIAETPLLMGLGGANAAVSDQRLPSLDAMLDHCKGRVYVDLDVKRPHQLPRIAEALRRTDSGPEVNLKMWIHGQTDLDYALSIQDGLRTILKPIVLIDRSNIDHMLEVIRKLDAPMIEANFDCWDSVLRLSDAAWSEGRDIFVNTLDEARSTFVADSGALQDPRGTWGTLLDAGVRMLQTDEPEALCTYLKTHRKAKA